MGSLTLQSGPARTASHPSTTGTPTPRGARLTLAQYAASKHLPMDFLISLGLHDTPDGVGIPYRNKDGSLYTTRTRLSLTTEPRFLQPTGISLSPYGEDRLGKGSALVLVEGESDCHTLWYHGFAALGLPGAGSWKREWRTFLTPYSQVYLYDEGNLASRRLANRIAADCPGVRRLKVRQYKDPSDLHMAESEDFGSLMRQAIRQAPIIRSSRRRELPLRPSRRPRRSSHDEEGFDIMATVSPYTQLRRVGSQWRGLCPLHEEHHASFYVNPQTNVWFCHGGCGRGGGVKDFLQLVGAR